MRMTKEVLRAKLEQLNSLTSNTYDFDYAYGGVRLVKICNEHGGVSDMSERVKKREMATILDALLNVTRGEVK